MLFRGLDAAKRFVFGWFALSLSLWSFFSFLMQITNDQSHAVIYCKVLMFFAVFIPVFNLHHIYELVGRPISSKVKLLYIVTIIAAFTSFTDLIVGGASPRIWSNFWPDPGVLLPVLLVLWFGVVLKFMYVLIKELINSSGFKQVQLRYVLVANIIGWSGGATNYLIIYGLDIPPVGNIFVLLYLCIYAYAVIKYRLMDIRLAATSASLFLIVYVLALGAPFYVYASGHHFLALALSIILATAAPFTYIYMQQKAKERLLAEQRAYQETLRQASAGMGRIRDLKKLLNLIVSVLTRAVRMEHAYIYIVDAQSGRYRLAASRRSRVSGVMIKPELPTQSMIVEAFNRFSDPLILEEVRTKAADMQDKDMEALAIEIEEFQGELIFPIYSRSDLIAVVVMGKKDRERIYTEDDLATFSILANQAALAIENANYFDDMRRTQEQLFQAEKLATIGTMADGLSHQVNNRFHALGFIAGDLLDTLSQYQKDPARFPINEVFDQLRGGLRRIEENVTQGGQVVRGLLDYSRNTKTEKGPVELKKLLTASLDMVGLKIHLSDFTWEVDFPDDIPHVLGHFVQLQEVFFNIIDNAHHSMMEKKNSRLEPGYEPHMTFRSRLVEGKVHITVTDNGMGVKPEDQRKLFTPFFTTKVSSRLGNGLGLFVMRKIIEDDHGGKIAFSSVYRKGVEINIVLPAAIL